MVVIQNVESRTKTMKKCPHIIKKDVARGLLLMPYPLLLYLDILDIYIFVLSIYNQIAFDQPDVK